MVSVAVVSAPPTSPPPPIPAQIPLPTPPSDAEIDPAVTPTSRAATPLVPSSDHHPFPIERFDRCEDGAHWPLLLWRAGPGWRMAGTCVLGGGVGSREWVINAQVPPGYDRCDPHRHLSDLAAALHLSGPGAGMMTAASVDGFVHSVDDGVSALATAGIGALAWAADPRPGHPGPPPAGTINILVAVPAPLCDAALLNCIATATEAKVQALLDAGYHGSGTASDAVCIAVHEPRPGTEPEPFGGPRSLWGARLARAVYAAVRQAAVADRLNRAEDIRRLAAGP